MCEGLHDDIDDWSETLAVDSDEAASDAHKDLDVMLADLPVRQREAIEHTRLQGLSITETAQRTGQSEGSVYCSSCNRPSRARAPRSGWGARGRFAQ